jgi:hypothetical protein
MKKLLMIVTISGFIAGTSAYATTAKCGDDKDKKCSKECCKKGTKEGKECCKKNADKKECTTASGEKKSCCKKGEKHEETKPANEQTK